MLCWNITVPQTRWKSGGSVMINLCNILRAGEKRLKWANYSSSAYSLYWHEKREREREYGCSGVHSDPRQSCLSSSSSTSPSAHYSARAFTLRMMNITSTSSTKSSLSKSHHNHPKMKSAHQTHTISHNFPEKMVEEVEQHWDCLVIGAGISGLDAAYHLKVFNMNKARPNFERC